LALATAVAAGCSSDSYDWNDFGGGGMPSSGGVPGGSMGGDPMSGGGMGGSSVSASIGELTSFGVDVDKTSLSESENVDSSDEDYIEYTGNDFSKVITITFDGNATVEGSVDGVTVDVSSPDVIVNSSVKGVRYILKGTTSDGSLKIYSDKKFELDLSGVSITNPTGPAINVQSGKRNYIVLVDGTTNTLTDGTSYDSYANYVEDEDLKACFFSEGKMLFSGSGSLSVYGNCKAGIRSDDYIVFRPGNNIYVETTAGNAIKGNDAIIIKGGVINTVCSATAGKGLSSDGYIRIDGGRTTAIVSGGVEYDSDEGEYVGAAGIKSDSLFTMNGGTVLLKATGDGGKGLKCSQQAVFNGGTLYALATGSSKNDVAPKAIRIKEAAVVNGATIYARSTGHEAFETKGTLDVKSGSLMAYGNDDAINSGSHMTLSGGFVYGYGEGNDGIDSNGNLIISGATAIAVGTTAPECGFDANEEEGYSLKLSGGRAIGLGGGTSYPSTASIPYFTTNVTVSSGSDIALTSSDGTVLWTFEVPRSYSGGTLLVADASMTKGTVYNLLGGVSVSGGTDILGFRTGATISGGSTLKTFTADR